ncbi:MAG: acyl-CoA dehydrogenase family protein [Dehalococcoidia bacterium]|jgi:alkylation response protein AidB-like acyl-CoA dehydrogenase|nr:acyl-CoA dehydrogenase family protein [Chloroflexota bacterium]MCK4242608.1 acyl-CoA dehydrogenase family protein [Dehalococcoidia bacterium]
MISFSPSEEQQMIINTLSEFAVNEMRELYRECDENGGIPAEIIDKAWEFGLIASSIPEKYGGFGSEHSAVTGALVAEELAWGDLSIAMHILCPALVAFPILETGSEEQKRKYLPLFCGEGYKPATAALIEPRFNFDASTLTTTARLDGNEYVLNGEKCYVPLAADADLMLVYASLDGATQGFIVENGVSRLEIGEREKNMGLKALATYELALRDCRIPKENRLGGEAGCDFNRILNYSRVALSAMAVGVARAAYEYSLDYAKQRYAFGEPIAARQAIAFMMAEMAIEIEATRFMTWEAAWELDRGKDATKDTSLVKMYADDMAVTVTDRAVQILGGHGYIRDHPVELWLRNGRGFVTFDGMAIV